MNEMTSHVKRDGFFVNWAVSCFYLIVYRQTEITSRRKESSTADWLRRGSKQGIFKDKIPQNCGHVGVNMRERKQNFTLNWKLKQYVTDGVIRGQYREKIFFWFSYIQIVPVKETKQKKADYVHQNLAPNDHNQSSPISVQNVA